MKKRNLVKKALLPAVVAVVCSIVALTSVSYAWFTMGNTASVESIDVNVTAADGVQISADAVSWKSVLPVSDLQEDGLNNQFPNTILPVSSIGNYVNGEQEMFIGEVQDSGLLVTKVDTVNYVAFDFYVSLASAQDFILANTSSVTSEAAQDGTQRHPEYATRVSFIYLGTEATADAAKNLGTSAEEIKIWEPNANSHIDAVGGTAKLDYYGVKAENANGFDHTAGANDTTGSLEEVSTFVLTAAADETLFQLNAGYSKIRVYIWLEGQDADCLNDISGWAFKVSLNFKTPEKTQNA